MHTQALDKFLNPSERRTPQDILAHQIVSRYGVTVTRNQVAEILQLNPATVSLIPLDMLPRVLPGPSARGRRTLYLASDVAQYLLRTRTDGSATAEAE